MMETTEMGMAVLAVACLSMATLAVAEMHINMTHALRHAATDLILGCYLAMMETPKTEMDVAQHAR